MRGACLSGRLNAAEGLQPPVRGVRAGSPQPSGRRGGGGRPRPGRRRGGWRRSATVPPWAATSSATMARPRPLPPSSRARASSRRTNRSNTRSRSASGMPGPSSSTASTHPAVALGDRQGQVAGRRGGRRCRRGCAAPAAARRRRRRPGRPTPRWCRPAARSPSRSRRGLVEHQVVEVDRALPQGRGCARRPGSAAAGPRPGAGAGGPRPARSSASSVVVVRPGWARATSACWRMEATGERSSWEASETSRRWRAWACSSRPSMRFIVRARRPISSSAGGSGTRRCRAAAEIASTSARIASTGARARPTTIQVVTATTTSSSGSPTASSPLTAADRLVDGLGGPDDHHRAPPQRGVGARGHGQERAVLARRARPAGTSTSAESPGRSRATGGRPGGVGAGRDHPAVFVQHLDQQLVVVVDSAAAVERRRRSEAGPTPTEPAPRPGRAAGLRPAPPG